MKIFIASDHAGFDLKEHIKKVFGEFEFEDLGAYSAEKVDYTDLANELAQKVGTTSRRGILVCGTGIGMNMAANKHEGVRAALCTNAYMAKLSRQHNDSNVLCLGERITGYGMAEEIVECWIKTAFEGGRHVQRLSKMVL